MRLTHIEIEGYRGFMFSNIEKLSADISDNIQIIIGTNGSGKSKFLSECSPLPTARTSYKAHGYKKLTLEHEGDTYTLTSDYTIKSGLHSFCQNGIELNESGTTPVQEELVQSYLCYLPTIVPILTNTYNFGRMSPGARKTLLMTLNPFNITFMLDDHKHITRKIKACKNNLSRLYDRKSQLESELLDENVRAKMKEDADALTEKVTAYISSLHLVSSHMTTLTQQKQTNPITSSTEDVLRNVTTHIRKARRHAATYSDIPREDMDAEQERIIQDIATCHSQITHIQDQIATITQDINEYTGYIEEITDPETSIDQLDADLDRLQAEMTSCSDRVPDEAPCSEDQLAQMMDVYDDACSLLSSFQMCEMPLRPPHIIRKKSEKLRVAQDRLEQYRYAHQQILDQLTDIDRKRSLSPKDIPEPCSRFACPLYRTFYEQFSSLEEKRKPLEDRRRKLDHRLRRYEKYVPALHHQVTTLKKYLPDLTRLYTLLYDTCPILGRTVSHLDILHTLSQNPFSLQKHWDTEIERAKTYYTYHKAKKDYETKRDHRAQKEKINTSTRDVFDRILREKYEVLGTHRTALNKHKIDLDALQEKNTNIRHYKAFCEKLKHDQDTLQAHETRQLYQYAYDVCKTIYDTLYDEKEKAVTKLGSLNHTLQDQVRIKSRYDDEVITQIHDIETTHRELLAIEKALSPSTGIPHKYMTTFVNALIKTMNHYISYVFSYPFVINEHDITQPLDYKFSAYVDDTYISDISSCSDAQNEMIDLAFCLALMRHLELSPYPLFLDETGRSFDEHHKHKLLDLFRHCVEENHISQLFLVNHHAVVHEGMANAKVMVLDNTNILTPAVYNTHVNIEYT